MQQMTLTDIRHKIDAIDTQIHDLLMQRGALVDDIVTLKKQDAAQNSQKAVIYQPAREALLLKKILKNHKGNLPYSLIIELWRSLLSAFCGMQCDFSIAFFDPAHDDALRDLIRYYFGSLCTLNKSSSESSILDMVKNDQVTLGILPVTYDEYPTQWWVKLYQDEIFVSNILPFIQNDPIIKTSYNYMVVSKAQPVKTGDDKSLFKVTGSPDVGRVSITSCFAELGYQAHSIAIFDANDLSKRYHLIEVDGFFLSEEIVTFAASLKTSSVNKIFEVDYLGSYPAPVDIRDF